MKYTLSENLTCRKTNTELQMLFDRDKGVMYELNESASAIIDQLNSGPKSSDELVKNLSQGFDSEDKQIKQDIIEFLQDFESAGLVIQKS